jgi:retron-type reverse transcriptase
MQDQATVFNNLGHIIDAEMLYYCYYQLDGNKAVGIDGVTKIGYLPESWRNLCDLLKRIRRGTYEPKPARVVEIPKEDGSKRPLAIACLEDKIIQSAVKLILEAIFEPTFLPCSFGFRKGESCHHAMSELFKHMDTTPNGAIVEIDIRKYFNRGFCRTFGDGTCLCR